MITKEDVEKFLENFFIKVKVFGIRFRNDRSKNYESLKELGITAQTRLSVVMDLKWEDYSAGPITDELNKGNDMWVFGKDVNGHEVYIKITMGEPSKSTICISFHVAEYPMQYPFKKQ